MNVLLVRPDGIGDEILCLPVASALRRLLPDARITFLSSEYAAPLLAHHPDLDEVRTVTGRETLGELVALFRRAVDAAVFLKPFKHLMWAAFLARVPIRVATGYRWYSVLANRRIYEHRKDFSKHETAYNVGMLAGLGLQPGIVSPPSLVLIDEERSWGHERMRGLSTPRVVLHPGGFAARRWRVERYHSLARELHRKGAGVVLTGSQAEADMFNQHGEQRRAASCLGHESYGAVIGARVDGCDCGESRGGLRSHRPGPYCRSVRCSECQPVRSTAQQPSDSVAATRPGSCLASRGADL